MVIATVVILGYRGNDRGNGIAFIKCCGNTAVMGRKATAPPW